MFESQNHLKQRQLYTYVLKKIILNGITTISTDFQMMGEKAAELILNKSSEHIEARFYLTLRNSL